MGKAHDTKPDLPVRPCYPFYFGERMFAHLDDIIEKPDSKMGKLF